MVEEGLTRCGQSNAVAVALEQQHPERLLKLPYRVADSARGQVKFARRVLERPTACCGLESANGGERNRGTHSTHDDVGMYHLATADASNRA
ncbi:hypothetical protein GCM10007886_48810 [Methylobacterium gregans]|nr:hypothetical protein GCM10007886_48810 [Methylobacterium gregans]